MSETLSELRDRTVERWQHQTFDAIRRIDTFAAALGRALGDISRDEAVDALKQQAIEEIERLR